MDTLSKSGMEKNFYIIRIHLVTILVFLLLPQLAFSGINLTVTNQYETIEITDADDFLQLFMTEEKQVIAYNSSALNNENSSLVSDNIESNVVKALKSSLSPVHQDGIDKPKKMMLPEPSKDAINKTIKSEFSQLHTNEILIQRVLTVCVMLLSIVFILLLKRYLSSAARPAQLYTRDYSIYLQEKVSDPSSEATLKLADGGQKTSLESAMEKKNDHRVLYPVANQELQFSEAEYDCFKDSDEQVEYVLNKSRSLRTNSFLQITQTEDLADIKASMEAMLADEFMSLKVKNEVDAFIEEFDHLVENLAQQTASLEQEPEKLDNLIQFKVQVHLIKLLSEMIQASYLRHFSQTIIDFLDDIVDGKTCMTKEIMLRLHRVVTFCNQYIYLLKNNSALKVKA
jgi:hypothetical protein